MPLHRGKSEALLWVMEQNIGDETVSAITSIFCPPLLLSTGHVNPMFLPQLFLFTNCSFFFLVLKNMSGLPSTVAQDGAQNSQNESV